MERHFFRGIANRFLQTLAGKVPCAASLRVTLHRWRGVEMGRNVWIGYDSIVETSRPDLVRIGNNVVVGIRVVIIAHFRGMQEPDAAGHSVVLEDDVFVGPGCIILPNVVIGRGAVVCAGSVVTRSVPPMLMVRGNPATPIARCGIPLTRGTPKAEFARHRIPLRDGDTGPLAGG